MNADEHGFVAAKKHRRHKDGADGFLYVVPPSGGYSAEPPEDSMM
ncbi:hypothetical protein [Pontiella sulfatireligans]|nr:hypothetical protein [Pontiella sulfatireligans]